MGLYCCVYTDCVNNTFLGLRMHDSGDQFFFDFFLTGKMSVL